MLWRGPSNTSTTYLREFITSKVKEIERHSHVRFKRSGKVHKRLTHQETKLLVEMSQLLAQKFNNSHELLQRFHWMVKGLVMTVGSPTWKSNTAISSWFRRTKNEAIISSLTGVNSTQGTCKDMRHDDHSLSTSKKSDNCFGMCGMYCWCWPWVCGDCCLHKGCFQHDTCCQRDTYLSVYCLCPWVFGFDCQHGYKGYPDCL